MATACLVNPSTRDLTDIADPATGTVTFKITAVGVDTYTDVDGDVIVPDVWLEFMVDTSDVQTDFGRGSGLEYPSWLSFVKDNDRLDSGTRKGDILVTIDLDLFPTNIDYVHLGVQIEDGVNPTVSGVFCFNSPYEP